MLTVELNSVYLRWNVNIFTPWIMLLINHSVFQLNSVFSCGLLRLVEGKIASEIFTENKQYTDFIL